MKEMRQLDSDEGMGEIDGGQKRQAEGNDEDDGWLEVASSIKRRAKRVVFERERMQSGTDVSVVEKGPSGHR